MAYVTHFKDLEVYQLSRRLAKEIFELSKSFPKEETYSLTDQIRRASRSIGGQIAEAWGRRKYERHFVSKLSDANGEQEETVHWIIVANDCRYVTEEIAQYFTDQYASVHRMLESMHDKSSSFCS